MARSTIALAIPLLGLLPILAVCGPKEQSASPVASEPDSTDACHILFDAGSSGTRGYLYVRNGESWQAIEGGQSSALADPVRDHRGKTWSDADTVVDELDAVFRELLTKTQAEGASCTLGTVGVFATAGMRLAEIEAPARSAELYAKVVHRLEDSLKIAEITAVPAEARTLSGFEEGLFAWLSVRESGTMPERFALAEMGGASTQFAFPCDDCADRRRIQLADQTFDFFSYSFLGLGTDEARRQLGDGPECSYGVGIENPGWQPASCEAHMQLANEAGTLDPDNLPTTHADERRVQLPLDRAANLPWALTGAFGYWSDQDQTNCCRSKGECHDPESACYRAVYIPHYLRNFGIEQAEAKPVQSSWTLGAVICSSSDCLGSAEPMLCRWRADGCAR